MNTLGALIIYLTLVRLGYITLYTAQETVRRFAVKHLSAPHVHRIEHFRRRFETELRPDKSAAYAVNYTLYCFPYIFVATRSISSTSPNLSLWTPHASTLTIVLFLGRWMYYLLSDGGEERYWLNIGHPWLREGRKVPRHVATLRGHKLEEIRQRRDQLDDQIRVKAGRTWGSELGMIGITDPAAFASLKQWTDEELLQRETAILEYERYCLTTRSQPAARGM